MNKHLFAVIAAAILATSMPVSLFSYKTKSKLHYHQYVRPAIKDLKHTLGEMENLSYRSKENVVRYIKDYAHNPGQKMPRLEDSNERALAQHVINSEESILAAQGNHKRAARNYLVNAVGTIILYEPGKAKVHASRSIEAARTVRKPTASTVHTTRGTARTSQPSVIKRNGAGTTGLAGQLPKSSRAMEASRASSVAKASAASRAASAKHASVKSAKSTKEVKPLHKNREKRKAIKREKRAKREAEERKAKRDAERKRKELESRRIALRSELRRLKY